MAIKGTTRIELTNVKTGKKEVYQEKNMVTNAVADILTLNPFGLMFRNRNIYYDSTSSSTNFEKECLPLCPNLFGGILLYEKTLEEDADQYFADIDNALIGYSSNDVNTGEDVKRGSMNQTESGPLEDGTGYRFVFDFASSQANGTISSLGLTSKWGGICGYGSTYDKLNQNVFSLEHREASKIVHETSVDTVLMRLRNIVSIDADSGEAIYAYVSDLNTITLGKMKFPVKTVGLDFDFSPQLEFIDGSETIVASTRFASVLTSKNVFFGTLIDGGDGYIWGFQHDSNAEGNSTGSATVLWIKISKEDYSFTEGSWTIDAQLLAFGNYETTQNNYAVNEGRYNNAIIKNGVLYAIKYTSDNYMYGVYKIPLDNPTAIELLEFEDGSGRAYKTTVYGNQRYISYNTNVNEINGVIVYRGGHISGGKLIPTDTTIMPLDKNGSKRCLAGSPKPGLTYGPFIFGVGILYNTTSTAVYNGYYPIMDIYLQNCYLATINNLATPVEKTADKTMKITYILREE